MLKRSHLKHISLLFWHLFNFSFFPRTVPECVCERQKRQKWKSKLFPCFFQCRLSSLAEEANVQLSAEAIIEARENDRSSPPHKIMLWQALPPTCVPAVIKWAPAVSGTAITVLFSGDGGGSKHGEVTNQETGDQRRSGTSLEIRAGSVNVTSFPTPLVHKWDYSVVTASL